MAGASIDCVQRPRLLLSTRAGCEAACDGAFRRLVRSLGAHAVPPGPSRLGALDPGKEVPGLAVGSGKGTARTQPWHHAPRGKEQVHAYRADTHFRRHGATPTADPTVVIAPTTVLSGAVSIGPGTQILPGAVLTAESEGVPGEAQCVIMEHAVIRGPRARPAVIRRPRPGRAPCLPERL